MTEWSVVLVIVTLIGLGAAIVSPIVSLTKAITTLTVVVDGLKAEMAGFQVKNSESHKRLWEHNEKQDDQLKEHEERIIRIEGR